MKRSLSSAAAAGLIGDKQGLRYSIASVLGGRPATAGALAEELEVPVTTVRRQLRVLKQLGLVETEKETVRRGVAERSYRLTRELIIDDEDFDTLPAERKEKIVRSIIRVALGDILRSVKAGLINRRGDRCVVRAPVLVDEEGWEELVRIHGQAYEEVSRVRGESELRLKEGSGESIPAVSILLFIELPSDGL